MEIYPAKYADKNGECETTIRNNWKILRMSVRSVEFCGSSFDNFRPAENTSKQVMDSFDFDSHGELSDFQIECEVPVRIFENDEESAAGLNIRFERKTGKNQSEDDVYDLLLTLRYKGQNIQSKVYSDFEDCLGEIKTQLGKLEKSPVLKCCFGCALSDYSVYGHGIFGDLICFKNLKERYLNMKTHYDYYDLLEETNLDYVQEIYLCSEYQARRPHTFYRG
jgi:hypothetical protein